MVNEPVVLVIDGNRGLLIAGELRLELLGRVGDAHETQRGNNDHEDGGQRSHDGPPLVESRNLSRVASMRRAIRGINQRGARSSSFPAALAVEPSHRAAGRPYRRPGAHRRKADNGWAETNIPEPWVFSTRIAGARRRSPVLADGQREGRHSTVLATARSSGLTPATRVAHHRDNSRGARLAGDPPAGRERGGARWPI